MPAAALERLLGGLDADDLQALAGEHLDDAGTHRAQAHHAHGREVSRHPAILPGAAARAWTGSDRVDRAHAARSLARGTVATGRPHGGGDGGVRNAQSTLAVDVRPDGATVVVRLDGDLDITSCRCSRPSSTRCWPAGADRRCTHLVVDMSGVGFADASGISPLLLARAMLARRGGRVELRHCRRAVLRLVRLLGPAGHAGGRRPARRLACAAVRLVIARCTRRLRRPAHRPPARGAAAAPGQGRRLGLDARRRPGLQAAELDEPAVHAARWHR